MTGENNKAVDVRNLQKKFGSFTAVDNISFSVERGEIFGFLGPNGAGKSTTIRMLCGIISPTAGYGRVAGLDIFNQSEDIKLNIGYMSQKFSLYEDMTPFENIRFYLGVYNVPSSRWKERIQWALEMANLQNVRDRLTGGLPPGWRQGLALGCALLHQPKILFLDEPTSGVDPIARRRFWGFIRDLTAEGITVFVTTHYMDEAENCDRIVMINEGRIVAHGPPSEIIHNLFPDQPDADLNTAFIRLMKDKSS